VTELPLLINTSIALVYTLIGGPSIVGIASGASVIVNPGPEEMLRPGDRLAVIGQPDHIREAEKLLRV